MQGIRMRCTYIFNLKCLDSESKQMLQNSKGSKGRHIHHPSPTHHLSIHSSIHYQPTHPYTTPHPLSTDPSFHSTTHHHPPTHVSIIHLPIHLSTNSSSIHPYIHLFVF